jgi:hypothetical protein
MLLGLVLAHSLSALPVCPQDVDAELAAAEASGARGNAFFNQGDYRQARDAYQRVLEYGRAYDDEFMVVRAQLMLGTVDRSLGNLDAAEAALGEARERAEGNLRPFELSNVLNELAILHGERGDLEERERLHLLALASARGQGGTAKMVAETLTNLVDLKVDQGEIEAARAYQLEALEFATKAGNDLLLANGEAHLGYLHLLAGEAERALEVTNAALVALDEIGSIEPILAALDTVARAALALGSVERVEDAIDRSRRVIERPALMPLSADERSRLRARHADWERTAQDFMAMKLANASDDERVADLVERGFQSSGFWKGRALLEELTSGEAATATIDLDELRARAVPEGACLIEYASGWTELYAYVLTHEDLLRVELGDRVASEGHVQAYVRALGDPTALASAAELASDGGKLYRDLLAPVLARLPGDPAQIVIVPTPALAALPFEALVAASTTPDEGELGMKDLEFVIDRRGVTYAPSHAVLARLGSATPRDGPTLVLADPLYPSERASDSGQRSLPDAADLGRLPGARQEALALVRQVLKRDARTTDAHRERLLDLWDERSFAFLEHPAVDLYVGAEANPDRLAGDLSGYTTIHIAAHAFADYERPRNTALALAFRAEQSGYVATERIRALHLDADLTVLSACETARGRVRLGEGVLSMSRSFLVAGSRSVVASLWRVDDAKAARTMEAFARFHVGEGAPASEALRRAKLEVRRTTGTRGVGLLGASPTALEAGHPYFWAPFIFVGPGR